MLDKLIADIDAHLAWRRDQGVPLADTTFGRQAVNDGKLLERLRAGGQITVAKAEAIRTWIKDDRASVKRGQAA